jgi:hypothetical protein
MVVELLCDHDDDVVLCEVEGRKHVWCWYGYGGLDNCLELEIDYGL